MTNEHPITPPPELVLQLIELPLSEEERLAAAYRAGADNQLNACCGFIGCNHSVAWSDKLRAACRPKPPSLKEQALAVLMNADGADYPIPVLVLPVDEAAIIRCALEALPDTP